MSYVPVLVLLGIGLALGGVILLLSSFLGPHLRNPMKDQPFECGVPPYGDARHRFSVRFYLVAILFLLFDVEAIFFFPWAIVFKQFLAVNSFILWEMGLFVGTLLVGFWYVLRKGALEWE
jgi:NADH-quinone oxidoreductase subunit A